MLKLPGVLAIAIFLSASAAPAKVLNFKEAPASAIGDGVTDDRPALVRAFKALEPGDVLFFPEGRYAMEVSKSYATVPKGVTLVGLAGKSILALTAKDPDYSEFLRFSSDVTLEGLTIERASAFSTVLFPIGGGASNVTFRNCVIDGQHDEFPKGYCHAFKVGSGDLQNFTLDGITLRGCSYGLFQPNGDTGKVDGVTVQRSLFEKNTASDLEFNAPKSDMRNVVVRDCIFRDNLSPTPSGGFAVGFANVQGAIVENCLIERYQSEALHVEDRSTNVRLSDNRIVGASLKQGNGVILVVNASKDVTIDHNVIDLRTNTNKTPPVLVTAGGTKFGVPTGVLVTDNVFLYGAATKGMYLQPGSGPAPTGNMIVPSTTPIAPAP